MLAYIPAPWILWVGWRWTTTKKKNLGNHGPFPCLFRVSGLDSFKQLLRVGSSGPLKPLSSLWSVRPVRIKSAGLAEGFIAAIVAEQAPKKPFTAVRVRGRSYTKIIKNSHTNSVSLVRHIIFLWWHTIQKFKNRCHLHPFTNQTLCYPDVSQFFIRAVLNTFWHPFKYCLH